MVSVNSELTSAGDDDSSYIETYDATGNLTQVDNSDTSDMPDVVLDSTDAAALPNRS